MINDWKQWKFAGIYCLTNLVNGKIYVGQSKNIANRIRQHKSTTNCKLISRAIKKYGFHNFAVSILESVSDISKLNEREQFWLDFYKPYSSDIGYNICPTAHGTLGVPCSDETKRKIRNSLTGKKLSHECVEKLRENGKRRKQTIETRNKIRDTHLGVPRTKEAIEHIRISKIGKRATSETKLKMKNSAMHRYDTGNYHAKFSPTPVYQLDKDTGEVIKLWKSMNEAKRTCGFPSHKGISNVCLGLQKTAYGYKWRYVNQERKLL